MAGAPSPTETEPPGSFPTTPPSLPSEGKPEDLRDSINTGEVPPGDEESFFAPSPEIDVPDQPEPSSPVHAPVTRLPETKAPRFQPATPEAVKKAIDEVMEILSSLRESVDKMDEVLEVLEEAERQKTADEREIDALRQQLRRFHRPAEEIPRPIRPPAGPQHGAQRDNPRQTRDARGSYRGQRDNRGGPRDRRSPQESSPRVPGVSGAVPPAAEADVSNEPLPADPPASARDPQGDPPYGTDAGDPS